MLEAQSLQSFLIKKFQEWQPQAPAVLERTKRSVTLNLEAEPFAFMNERLLYKIQRKEKIPQWVTVYSGCKTTVTIENLAPSHPHKFRLQVILKSTAISSLAEEAIKHYGDEDTIHDIMNGIDSTEETYVKVPDGKDDVAKQPKDVFVTTLKKPKYDEIIGKQITLDQKTSQEINEPEEVNTSIQNESIHEKTFDTYTDNATKENTQRLFGYTESGCKTTVTIENLAPSHPHKFRLQVILKSTAISSLAEEAIKHYGDEDTIHDIMNGIDSTEETYVKVPDGKDDVAKQPKDVFVTTLKKPKDDEIIGKQITLDQKTSQEINESEEVNTSIQNESIHEKTFDTYTDNATKENTQRLFGYTERSKTHSSSHKWLESRWSEETWTSTDTDGTSAMCFCMAVRCGYYKQIQIMLDERPNLIGAINSSNGLTPLATAVRKGDLNIVKYLLSLGAEVDQPTTAGQTPLHLAVLAGHTAIADLLLEKGANFQAKDINGLRVEHYAVDSCKLEVVKYIMKKGGDVKVVDSNGWTPLFRAVCQGVRTEVIEELLHCGSNVDVTDRRGLTLVAAARLLKNRQGRSRDSILRLVDSQFPHEKALANFTRLTKKIYSVHTLLK